MSDHVLGWNPLLGVPPGDLYDKLKKLAVGANASFPNTTYQLFGPSDLPPQRLVRWPFLHRGDRLVHALLGLYATRYWRVSDSDAVPVEAITDCGVLALMRPTVQLPPVYDSGEIVPGDALTCIRCMSGVEYEGTNFRQTQKENMQRGLYGMSPEKMSKLTTSQPNMQQVPRTITGRMSSQRTNMQPLPPRKR